MIILGIETSCDETAAAVLKQDEKGRIQILSNVIASSAQLQSKYGGIIPEQAAREQLKSIIPVIKESLQVAGYRAQDVDAIAATYGPGLIGSLLVGIETAKTLSKVWQKPLIPVNHLIGHFYANWIDSRDSLLDHSLTRLGKNEKQATSNETPKFPAIGLLVSGGHTDLVLFKNHGKYEYLGGTRDDAAGECFDKCARLLGLPYPGGPEISKLASQGDSTVFNLPSPMIHSKDFDFSFSGLKTAVARIVDSGQVTGDSQKADLAAAIEKAIVDVIVQKTIAAAQKYKVEQIIVAGGVAANRKLVSDLNLKCQISNLKLFVPPPELCTDNGAMIAAAAFFIKPINHPLSIQANPNLSL